MLTEVVCVHPRWLNSAKDAEWYPKSINALGSLACKISLRIEMVVRHMESCNIGEYLKACWLIRLRTSLVTGARPYE